MKREKLMVLFIIILLISGIVFFNYQASIIKIPKPEVTGGERGKLGIDKNILLFLPLII